MVVNIYFAIILKDNPFLLSSFDIIYGSEWRSVRRAYTTIIQTDN